MKHRTRWTDADKKVALDPGLTAAEAARLLDRTIDAVQQARHRFGFQRRHNPRGTAVSVSLTEEQLAWVDAITDAVGGTRASFIRALVEEAIVHAEANREWRTKFEDLPAARPDRRRTEPVRWTPKTIRPRVTCPYCGKPVILTYANRYPAHHRADGVGGRCPMSRKDHTDDVS